LDLEEVASDKTPEASKALLAGKQAKVEALKTRLHGIQQQKQATFGSAAANSRTGA
jgi:hypothetical protein